MGQGGSDFGRGPWFFIGWGTTLVSMSEGIPQRQQRGIERASLEGNVRIPQQDMGIALFTLDRLLKEEEIGAAIESLVAPIPDDEQLAQRTKRANAQHEFHGIGRTLTTERVRSLQLGGNYITLGLLHVILGATRTPVAPDHSKEVKFAEDGTWEKSGEDEWVAELKEKVQALAPEDLQFLKNLIHKATEVLMGPVLSHMVEEYKKQFSNWEQQDDRMQALIVKRAEKDMDTIQLLLKNVLTAYAEEQKATSSQRLLLVNLLSILHK